MSNEAAAAEAPARTPNTAGDSLSLSFTVEQSPEQAYAAITNVRGWWSENIEGATDALGVFVYNNLPVHVARIEVTELVPHRRVGWKVLENDLSFIEDKSEWVGNEMVFDIEPVGDRTRVTFTQHGLVPAYECYEICKNAWGGYINGSLRAFISVGKGSPVPRFA